MEKVKDILMNWKRFLALIMAVLMMVYVGLSVKQYTTPVESDAQVAEAEYDESDMVRLSSVETPTALATQNTAASNIIVTLSIVVLGATIIAVVMLTAEHRKEDKAQGTEG